jgi:hypothetical protein
MKGWLVWVKEIVACSGRRVADRDGRVARPTRFTFMSQPWGESGQKRFSFGIPVIAGIL